MRVLIQVLGSIGLALVPLVALASEARSEVDANIITALDASGSVGRYEEWVEREGLAQALAHPRFLEAIRRGPHKRIGFAVFAWSSHGHTKMLVPWTTIATPEDAERVSEHLRAIHLIEEIQLLDRDIPTDHYEAPAGPHQTDIALAVYAGSAHLGSAPAASRRSVINIVGNGPSNSGVEPALARDTALDAGQVVNGLVVGYALGSDVEYYRRHVIGGPGSFVLQVSNLHEVTEAFLAKFRLDIVGLGMAAPTDERFLTAYTTANQPDP
jgi:hypothetical protein